MLIAGPRERVFRLHQFNKSVEGDRSQNEEQGDKHRRKKYISHNTARREGLLGFPKGGAKVDIKKASLEFRDSFGNDGNISVISVLNR